MPRGVRVWDEKDRAGDLFADVPPAPSPTPAPAAKPGPGPNHRPYTGAENRRLERALDLFKDWLFTASLKALQSADPKALTKRFPPMQEWDVAEMIERQIARYDEKDETFQKWQRIR